MTILCRRTFLASAGGAALAGSASMARAQAGAQPLLIYADGLKNDWTTIGWARVQLESPLGEQKPVQLFMAAWSTFGFQRPTPVAGADFATLTVVVHGGEQGRQGLRVRLKSGNTEHRKYVELTARAGAWDRFDFSIQRHLGVRDNQSFDTIEVFNPTGNELPPWYLNFVLLQ